MICRALAALALGGSLFILLPDPGRALDVPASASVAPDIIERYRQSLETDQGNLTLHYLLGIALLLENRNAEALTQLQTAYPAYQASIEANYNLAIASLRLGDLVSTEIYLDQAMALGAADTPGLFPIADIYFNMALKSLELGDPEESIQYFHKVLVLSPQRYEVYRQLGDIHAQRNETDLAIKSFRTYLEHVPDDPISREYLFSLQFNRAQNLLVAKDLTNAVAGFEAALEIQPDSPAALYYLGFIAYSQDQLEQAANLLQQAFHYADDTLQQTIRPLLYNSALGLRNSGKSATALRTITILADEERALFNELFLAGTLNLDLGNYTTAYDYLKRAADLNNEDPGARQNLLAAELGAFNEWLAVAGAELQKENLDKADAAWQRASMLQPHNAKVAVLKQSIDQARLSKASGYFHNSRTALDAGDVNAAFEQVKAGLAMQPDNAEGLALREKINTALAVGLDRVVAEADLAMQAGNWDKAMDTYSQALMISPRHPGALAGQQQTKKARQRYAVELLEKGRKALDAGQIDLAVSAFDQLLALQPGFEPALELQETARQMKADYLDELLLKGRQALEHNRFPEARNWFNQALAVDDTGQAEQELVKLKDRALKSADELAIQAEAASRKGKYKQAGELYLRALKLVPGHDRSLSGKNELGIRINAVIQARLDEADQALRQADYMTATNSYRAILDIAPENRQALDGLQVSRAKQADALNQLVRQGEEALAAGDLLLAEHALTQALQQDAYHKAAQQLRQRLDKVRQSGAQPGDEQSLYLQGVAYYTQGKYTEAIKSWEMVLLLNPGHEKAAENIAKTRRKLRQIKEYRGG